MDGVCLTDVHIAPIPLQRFVHPGRIASGSGEKVTWPESGPQS